MVRRVKPLLLIVTGPPGVGKTTVAEALAPRLGLPLLAKDDLKETLHDASEAKGESGRSGSASQRSR
jgi:adenylate kinase family enzyme